jgi:hypothetical protein
MLQSVIMMETGHIIFVVVPSHGVMDERALSLCVVPTSTHTKKEARNKKCELFQNSYEMLASFKKLQHTPHTPHTTHTHKDFFHHTSHIIHFIHSQQYLHSRQYRLIDG